MASQTMWYGVSSIAARMINYLLTPLLTYSAVVSVADFGKIGLLYAAIPVLNVLFTYGFETTYFRFSAKDAASRQTTYDTAFISLIVTTLLFAFFLYRYPALLGGITGMQGMNEVIRLSVLVIAFDTLCAIPFARLRQEGKPRKYALVKVLGILFNIFFTWFFISYCPRHALDNSISRLVYDPNTNPVTYVVAANLIQAVVTLLLLSKEVLALRFRFNLRLWKEMMVYALPLVIVGFGGVINETFDRLMLRWWLPYTPEQNDAQVGIYNACYKLSILITLFVQAFRMSAEPFFFRQAQGQQPQKVYARVLKFFVIVLTFMFLVVALFLDVWKYMIGPKYWAGLKVVPVLLFANIFLGVYYNLSVWFKLGNKTIAGAYITLAGTCITVLINFLLIPAFSYMACAWATFCCYGLMMVLSFTWGQKVYRIPYAWKKLLAYMVIVALLYGLHALVRAVQPHAWINYTVAVLLIAAYGWFVLLVERKEFLKIPYINRLVPKLS